jgi:hypothetical protein
LIKAIRHAGVAALAVSALLAAGGCGSSPSSSTTSPTPSPSPSPKLITSVDACTLVTASDASTATGATLTNPSAGGGAVPGACFYASSDGKTFVIVYAQSLPDATAAQGFSPDAIAAALTSGSGLTNPKILTGIGDKAVEYTINSSGSTGNLIFVAKANVVMMIVITPSTSSTAIENLAKSAVGHLSG